MGSFILGIVFLAVVVIVFFMLDASKKKDELKKCINALPSFETADPLSTPSLAIGINAEQTAFAVAWRKEEIITTKRIEGKDMIGVEIERIGSSSKTKKTGFVSFTSEEFVDQINLCVKFRDKEVPVLRIPLYILSGKPDANAKILQSSAMTIGQSWEARILSVSHTTSESIPKIEKTNMVGELAGLHQLLKDGAITEIEYNEAKTKILMS